MIKPKKKFFIIFLSLTFLTSTASAQPPNAELKNSPAQPQSKKQNPPSHISAMKTPSSRNNLANEEKSSAEIRGKHKNQKVTSEKSEAKMIDSSTVEFGEEPPLNVRRPLNFGMGLGFGISAWPLAMKLFLTEKSSIEALGPSWGGVGLRFGYGLIVDGLYEGDSFYKTNGIQFAWQVGGGIDLFGYLNADLIQNYHHFGLGFHANGGIQMLFDHYPFDVVLEYRPGFTLEFTQYNVIEDTFNEKGVLISERAFTKHDRTASFMYYTFMIQARYYFFM